MSGENLEGELKGKFHREQIRDEVVEFHRRFWPDYSQLYDPWTAEISAILEGYMRNNKYFTDHGVDHTYRIIDNITRLEDELEDEFKPIEAFILCSCAWLHDVGMVIEKEITDENLSEAQKETEWFQEIGTEKSEPGTIDDEKLIRKWHHILSWNFIRNEYEQQLNFPSWELTKEISNICRSHRRKEDFESLQNNTNLQIFGDIVTVHSEALAAIFQLADALDTDRRRAKEIETEYVLELPEESQKHWKVCQIISFYTIESEDSIIKLEAYHKNSEDLDLLREKIRDLYEECDTIEDTLAAEPYSLNIVNVICISKNRHDDEKEEINGKKTFRNFNKKRNQKRVRDLTQEQTDKFKDLTTEWRIQIFNQEGDAEITRKIETEFIDEDVTKRSHFVQSYDTASQWDWSKDIRAWDQNGTDLTIEKEMDRGTYKQFAVVYPDNLNKSEKYKYNYKYRWEKYFPKDHEFFEADDKSKQVLVHVEFPDSISITDIWCEEQKPGKQETEKLEIPISTGNLDITTSSGESVLENKPATNQEKNIYTWSVEKSNRDSVLYIHWEVSQ